jgi:muramoyltetrapeptide carboxypeptidase
MGDSMRAPEARQEQAAVVAGDERARSFSLGGAVPGGDVELRRPLGSTLFMVVGAVLMFFLSVAFYRAPDMLWTEWLAWPAAVAAQPTLFIGFSDNTSLLSWLTCQCGVSAVHGPMLEGRLAGGAGYDEASFTRLVSGEAGYALKPVGLEVLRPGTASGPLFGGTLTQLVASLGTPFAFDPPEGCVLLIEDVNERPYRLDRMLTQLAQAGVLSRACGIVFGEMRGCDEPGGRLGARDAIARMTHEFAGPILAGFPSGHTTGPTWSLPLGVRVGIAASEHPALVVEEAVVE